MKNNIIIYLLLSVTIIACKKFDGDGSTSDSKAVLTSIPDVSEIYLDDYYAFQVGKNDINTTIPDTVALLVDTLVGFENGFGGKTKKDSFYLRKKDVLAWPDTSKSGAKTLTFNKYNNAGFVASVSVPIVLVSPLPSPGAGPTNFAGQYKRTSNGVIIDLIELLPGQYLITNPGGAGVEPFPYVLNNFKNLSGNDSLTFAIQDNPCHGGLQLVAPTAPSGLTSAEYSTAYPPAITSRSPLTISWRIYEFLSSDPSAVHPGAAQCQWGLGIRTFAKQ